MGKRPADEAPSGDAAKQHHKRSRTGIRAVLPTSDDAWRRKLERTKEANVRLAKTRQVFAKVKARALAEEGGATKIEDDAAEGMHPDRQARLDDDGDDDGQDEATLRQQRDRPARRNNAKRPQPFQKAREEAEQRQAETEARQAEHERRTAERETKRVERARHQKAMVRARRVDGGGGDNQRRKLGRESGVLLDKVRRMMGK